MGKKQLRRKQCTATSKQSGQRCRRWAVAGYNVCQVHGAGSPLQGRPGGSPVTHNRYSSFFNTDTAKKLDEIRSDQRLMDLADEMDVARARIAELSGIVDAEMSLEAWRRSKEIAKEMQKAKRRLDAVLRDNQMSGQRRAERTTELHGEIDDLLDELLETTTNGAGDFYNWQELQSWLEQTRKLAESERRRRTDLYDVMQREEAFALVAKVKNTIINRTREFFDDDERTRRYLSSISNDFRALVGDRSRADGSGDGDGSSGGRGS